MSCAARRRLAAEFASAARLYAESAVRLATSDEPGIDYTSLCQTLEAQNCLEVAFRVFMEHVASHPCGENLPKVGNPGDAKHDSGGEAEHHSGIKVNTVPG
jgi:hypothetical protein